jgi:hypothetical protein
MPILVSGLAYYLLGALWFSPLLFQNQWDRALGFERPPGWKPSLAYYLGPLLGCISVAFATYLWAQTSHSESWERITGIGFHVGLLVSLPITLTNAISPKTANPWLFTAVVGTYHVVGATLVGAVIAWTT